MTKFDKPVPKALDAITDLVLAFRATPKSETAKKRVDEGTVKMASATDNELDMLLTELDEIYQELRAALSNFTKEDTDESRARILAADKKFTATKIQIEQARKQGSLAG